MADKYESPTQVVPPDPTLLERYSTYMSARGPISNCFRMPDGHICSMSAAGITRRRITILTHPKQPTMEFVVPDHADLLALRELVATWLYNEGCLGGNEGQQWEFFLEHVPTNLQSLLRLAPLAPPRRPARAKRPEKG